MFAILTPSELVRFLKFVTADLEESEGDFQDELVKQFQETIRNIKTDRKMGERYMIFEEMLREEKQEGRQEGRLEATRENKPLKKLFWNSWKIWANFPM